MDKDFYLKNNLVIPKSVAIIMDGNGRYAEKKHIKRELGHKAGCDNLEKILEEAVRIGIEYLYVYAFSTENWKRSEEEINALMDLFYLYLPRIKTKAMKNDVKVSFIGDLSKFSKKIYDGCIDLIESTKNNNSTNFVIAFNYGARDEIVRAIKKINENGFNIDDLSEKNFIDFLDTKNMLEPDLLIRTSGELRLSNFMLWQLAYTEIYVTDCLWPEFDENELFNAIKSFNNRKRRFGGR